MQGRAKRAVGLTVQHFSEPDILCCFSGFQWLSATTITIKRILYFPRHRLSHFL